MLSEGRARVVGDDINTDYIISGRYKFKTLDRKELASHLLEDYDPDFVARTKPGDIIVAGRNFGCGSSREQAPLAIQFAGISLVAAASFARIFFRNCINVGLPLIECDTAGIEEGEPLAIDFKAGRLTRTSSGRVITFKPLPEIMLNILAEGGLAPYFQKHGGFKL